MHHFQSSSTFPSSTAPPMQQPPLSYPSSAMVPASTTHTQVASSPNPSNNVQSPQSLLQSLVRSFLPSPPPSDSNGQPSPETQFIQQEQQRLHSLAIALAKGGPQWRAHGDEAQMVNQAKIEIAHRSSNTDSGLRQAAEFESLYRKWRHLSSMAESTIAGGSAVLVQKRRELMYFMMQLKGLGEERSSGGGFGLGLGLSSTVDRTQPASMYPTQQQRPSSQQQQLTPYDSNSYQRPSTALTPATQPPSSFQPPPLHHESDLTEPELLRDLLYNFLGRDGNYSKYNKEADAYLLPPTLNISRPQRMLVQRISELGWLYRKIQRYVAIIEGGKQVLTLTEQPKRLGAPAITPVSTPNAHSGKIEQSFAAALREELNEYIRFITVLETEVERALRYQSSLTSNAPASGPHFTLLRTLVFEQSPLHTLSLLALLTDSLAGLKGGCITSVIGTHLRHGDPEVVKLMKRVMAKACVPLFSMIETWVGTGLFKDDYSEFFIQTSRSVLSNPKLSPEQMWNELYTLNRSMIPGFLSERVVNKILSIGKAVNFIRGKCEDFNYTCPVKIETKAVLQQMFNSGAGIDLNDFNAKIDQAFDAVNSHLLTLLTQRYHFLAHGAALKKYLLLSSGDFTGQLLETMDEQLLKPARDLSYAQLLGVLESAKRTSSARDDADYILDRLQLQRMQPVTGAETGYDLFSLNYHLDDSPLRVVFTDKNHEQYLSLFQFLWQLKRVEYVLNQSWFIQTKLGHSASLRKLDKTLSEFTGETLLEPFLRNVSGLRNEMIHFISNLTSYMMFEVIECSWEEFLKKIGMSHNSTTTGNTTTTKLPTTTTTSSIPNSPSSAGTMTVNFANGSGVANAAAPSSAPSSTSTKPGLDLEGLIQAHKLFLQQIVDKILMGGSTGQLHPQLLTLFQHVLSYSSFNARLYSTLNAEIDRRRELERAIVKSEQKGGWNQAISPSNAMEQKAQEKQFLVLLTNYVQEFRALNHAFHSGFITFLKTLRETHRAATLATKFSSRTNDANGFGGVNSSMDQDEADEGGEEESKESSSISPPDGADDSSTLTRRARRLAMHHLHSLDFLRFRLDFNEFYAVNRKDHQRMVQAYETHFNEKSLIPTGAVVASGSRARLGVAPSTGSMPSGAPLNVPRSTVGIPATSAQTRSNSTAYTSASQPQQRTSSNNFTSR